MQSVISISRMQQALIASVQVDLSVSILQAFEDELLDMLGRDNVRGVLIELSGLKSCSQIELNRLLKLSRAIEVMGRRCIFVGMRPGLVLGLLDAEMDTTHLVSVSSIEQAMARLI
ncbi:MAG: STAS domain-containing protein [Vibrio sp.]